MDVLAVTVAAGFLLVFAEQIVSGLMRRRQTRAYIRRWVRWAEQTVEEIETDYGKASTSWSAFRESATDERPSKLPQIAMIQAALPPVAGLLVEMNIHVPPDVIEHLSRADACLSRASEDGSNIIGFTHTLHLNAETADARETRAYAAIMLTHYRLARAYAAQAGEALEKARKHRMFGRCLCWV